MVYLYIGLAAIIFFEVFARSGTLDNVRSLNEAISDAFRIIRDPSASDLEKELASRKSAVIVLKFLGLTIFKIAGAIILSTLSLWVLCSWTAVSFQNAVALSASLLVIAALIPLMLIYGGLRHVFRH